MNRAVRAARAIRSASPGANQCGCLAEGLAAGGAGGEAVVIGAAKVEIIRQVARRGVHLLLVFRPRVETHQAAADEAGWVHAARSPARRSCRRPRRRNCENPGCLRRRRDRRRSACARPCRHRARRRLAALAGRPRRPACCWSRRDPATRIAYVSSEVEILDLGGSKLGGKRRGIEQGDRADAALAPQLIFIQVVDAVPQRGDRAHAGDDDSTSHGKSTSRPHASLEPWGYRVHPQGSKTRPLAVRPSERTTTAPHCPMSVKLSLRKYGLVTRRSPLVTATGQSSAGVR